MPRAPHTPAEYWDTYMPHRGEGDQPAPWWTASSGPSTPATALVPSCSAARAALWTWAPRKARKQSSWPARV